MWSGAGNAVFGGAGDLATILSMGAGDPLGFSTLRIGVRVIGSEFLWDIRNDTSRQSSPVEYSQQGGALIDLVSTLAPWPEGVYRVRLTSVLGQTFPQVFPNAHSGIEGKNDEIVPIYSSVLRFAMPRVPLGVYSIKILYESSVMEIPDAIRAVPDPSSLEVNRFRGFFNVEVYSKRGPVT
jgi:hypothetical protein